MADVKISGLPAATTPLAGTEVLPIVQSTATKKVSVADLTAGRSISATGANLSSLTASNAVATDANKNLVSVANTGTGNNVLATSPTITTPTLSGTSAIGATVNGGVNAGFVYYKGLLTGAEWLVGPLNSSNSFEWKNETSDKYLLQLGNTGNLKVYEGNLVIGTSGKGIDFSATPGTGTSELLDDYEEGTFTPTAVGGSSAGTTTYTVQNGYYTKIGRQVNVTLLVAWSALTGTGDLRISDLPFSIDNLTQNVPVGSCSPSDLNWSSGTMLVAEGQPNTTYMILSCCADDAAVATQQCVNESAGVRITMTYFTAT